MALGLRGAQLFQLPCTRAPVLRAPVALLTRTIAVRHAQAREAGLEGVKATRASHVGAPKRSRVSAPLELFQRPPEPRRPVALVLEVRHDVGHVADERCVLRARDVSTVGGEAPDDLKFSECRCSCGAGVKGGGWGTVSLTLDGGVAGGVALVNQRAAIGEIIDEILEPALCGNVPGEARRLEILLRSGTSSGSSGGSSNAGALVVE